MTSPLPPEPLSSVSSLEVHFDLLDLTELTDMSDQELAEVFADSDDEQLTGESPAGWAGGGVPGGGSGVLQGDPGARGQQILLLQTRVFENNFIGMMSAPHVPVCPTLRTLLSQLSLRFAFQMPTKGWSHRPTQGRMCKTHI